VIGTLSRPLPKKQISRLLLVDLAVIVVLVGLPVRTSWNDYTAARNALREQDEERNYYTQQTTLAQGARNQMPVTIGEIRALNDVLQNKTRKMRGAVETADIQEDIRDLVRTRRLTYLGLRPQEPVPYQGFLTRSLTLDVQGTFSRLLRFLYELRNMDSMILVGRVRFERAASTTMPGMPGATASQPQTGDLLLRAELLTVHVDEQISPAEIIRVVTDSTWVQVTPGSVVPPPLASGPDTARVGG